MQKNISIFIVGFAMAIIAFAANYAMADVEYSEQMRVPAIIIGKTDGSGGVTQFNGTMINNTPEKPITMGDDLRVDGRIWRGSPNDSQSVQIEDGLHVSGTTESDRVTARKVHGQDEVSTNFLQPYGIFASIGDNQNRWDYIHAKTLFVDFINYSYVGSSNGPANAKENTPECTEEHYGKMKFSKEGIDGGKQNQFYGCTGEGWKEL